MNETDKRKAKRDLALTAVGLLIILTILSLLSSWH